MQLETPQLATRAARQDKIRQIVASQAVSSQDALRTMLRDCGFEVTQATLSRDLEQLHAQKIVTTSGRRIYRIGASAGEMAVENAGETGFSRWAREVLVSAQCAANQIVLRTPPGAAQLLASALDNARFDGVLGCIAGDDTVLVIVHSAERATELTNELITMTTQKKAQRVTTEDVNE
ncbi:arginine repressor [Trueperella sp. LYQ143]|uniref:arginine repressor n=1 Tax=unclassified Trueperella TaxID=2630174 RepID=UPI003983BF9B